MEKKTTDAGGGFLSILFLVFLVLKLTDVINWSWWWVTAPMWIPVAFLALIWAVYFILKLFSRKGK